LIHIECANFALDSSLLARTRSSRYSSFLECGDRSIHITHSDMIKCGKVGRQNAFIIRMSAIIHDIANLIDIRTVCHQEQSFNCLNNTNTLLIFTRVTLDVIDRDLALIKVEFIIDIFNTKIISVKVSFGILKAANETLNDFVGVNDLSSGVNTAGGNVFIAAFAL